MKARGEWILLGVAVAVAIGLWQVRGGTYHAGQEVEEPITLVSKDRSELSCALASTVGQYRCEFSAPGEAWPSPPSEGERLVPYMTSDQILYLIPGLFELPALAARHADRALWDRRFTAQCQLRLVEQVEAFSTRWGRANGWGSSGPAWVAEPVNCVVGETD